MKNGCAAVVAATVIMGSGLAPTTVEAGCNFRNPTACTADTPLQTEATQPQAQAAPAQAAAPQAQTEAVAKPLQLKRYLKLGPARRAVSRSSKRRTARRRASTKTATAPRKAQPKVTAAAPKVTETEPKVTATASAKAGADAPVTPRAIPTVSISTRALALAPKPDNHTVGFNAETTPWRSDGVFAYASEEAATASEGAASLPAGMTIARFDEVNEIDRAADASASVPSARSGSLTNVSLVTPANAAPAPQANQKAEQEQSWMSWLYAKVVDGVLAAALMVRSLFG